MNPRTKKFLMILLVLAAIFAFVVLYVRAFHYYPSDEVELPPEVEEELMDNIPDIPDPADPTAPTSEKPDEEEPETSGMRIIIPDIDVNAKIQEVGITSKGNMASPRNFSDVGWYKYGTFPGEIGSAVLAGHVDNGIAFPAVFHDLGALETGDDIYVRTQEGDELHFKVTGRKIYPYDSAPAEVFIETEKKLIRLITCTGDIIRELRTHADRLVITAELQEA